MIKKEPKFYAKDDEIRAILYSDMKINDIEHSPADVCFVCDITGSMDKYIKSVQEVLIDFIKHVSDEVNISYPMVKPRIAFVMYKDKKDKDQITIREFDRDIDEMVKFVEKIKCKGGNDRCEDIVTALREALNLKWSSDLNLVYLITDAPPHGKSYHTEECSDDYPEDDEEKPLERLALDYRKKKIHLGVLKCNNSVDKMIDILKMHYNSESSKLIAVDIGGSDLLKKDYPKFFLQSLMKSFTENFFPTRYKNFRIIGEKSLQPEKIKKKYEIEFETPFRGKVNTGSITRLAFEKKEYDYSIELVPSAEVECKISGVTIGFGVFAKCFPLHVGTNTNYVAKLPKKRATKAEDLFPDIEATLFTKLLADKFNHLLKQAMKEDMKEDMGDQTKCPSVKVLSLTIIENLNPEESKRSKFFLAQQLLSGEYVKFNNNYGWKSKEKDTHTLVAQAFSHFTYEYTTGVVMVTDIQGIKGAPGEITITDPAIHSFVYNQQFGRTNYGKLGMIRFFMTHECNDYCKMLDLMHPNLIDYDKVQSIKEKRKKEKGLMHLFEGAVLCTKRRIDSTESLSMKKNSELASLEQELNEDCTETTYSVNIIVRNTKETKEKVLPPP